MYTIVNNNMVNGIRRVSVERGYDPRDFVLVGAGGATAAHITALAREMGIDTIILPKLASGLCAFGQIISDVKYNYMATAPLRLDNAAAYKRIDTLFSEIESAGRGASEDATASRQGQIDVKRSLDMRYVGQVHECTVDIGTFPINAKTIEQGEGRLPPPPRGALHLFRAPQCGGGRQHRNRPSMAASTSPRRRSSARARTPAKALKGHRKAIFEASGKAHARHRSMMVASWARAPRIAGPAIIEEVTTTIVIEPGWTAKLDASGSYVITRKKK